MKIQQTVWVTNLSEATHTDRFDGEDVTFAPGEAVQLPIEIARHFFGWGLEDKRPTLSRLGWIGIGSSQSFEQALDRLDHFAITEHHPLQHPNRVHSAAAVVPVAAGEPAQAPVANTAPGTKKAVLREPKAVQ